MPALLATGSFGPRTTSLGFRAAIAVLAIAVCANWIWSDPHPRSGSSPLSISSSSSTIGWIWYVFATAGLLQLVVWRRLWKLPDSEKPSRNFPQAPSQRPEWLQCRQKYSQTVQAWREQRHQSNLSPAARQWEQRLLSVAFQKLNDWVGAGWIGGSSRVEALPSLASLNVDSTIANNDNNDIVYGNSLRPLLGYGIHCFVQLLDRLLLPGAKSEEASDKSLVRAYFAATNLLWEHCAEYRRKDSSPTDTETEFPAYTRTRIQKVLADERQWLRGFFDVVWARLRQDSNLAPLLTDSSVLCALVREWTVNTVLLPAIHTLSRPVFLNRVILEYTTRRMVEQRLAMLFRETLEMTLAFPPQEFLTQSQWRNRVVANMSDKIRYLDSLFKSVKRCRSIADAKNVRFGLLMELWRAEHSAKTNSGSTQEALQKYIRQLQLTKQKYEKRIQVLTNESIFGMEGPVMGASSEAPSATSATSSPTLNTLSANANTLQRSYRDLSTQLELRTMLEEWHLKKSETLFYFLHFMEKTGMDKKVQFWLEVERMKQQYGWKRIPTMDSDSPELLVDIQKIYDAFLSQPSKSILHLHPKTDFALRQYLGHVDSTEADVGSIFVAQEEVLKDMEVNNFPAFLKSDSFFRWLSDRERHQPDEEALASPGMTTRPLNPLEKSAPSLAEPVDRDDALLHPRQLSRRNSFQQDETPEQRLERDCENSEILLALKRNVRNILNDASVAQAKELHMQPSLQQTMPAQESTSSPPRSPNRLGGFFRNSLAKMANISDVSPFADLFLLNQGENGGAEETSGLSNHGGSESPRAYHRSAFWNEILEAILFQISLVEHLLKKDVGRSDFFDGVLGCLGELEYLEPDVSEKDSLARLVRRMLARTREGLRKELADLMEKKMLAEKIQEQDFIVPGKWRVSVVPSGSKSMEQVYFVEVFKEDSVTGVVSNWIVPRQFPEFQALHLKLREKYPNAQEYAGKLFQNRVTWHRPKKELMQERQEGLQMYMQQMVQDPLLCQSAMLRSFLANPSSSMNSRRRASKKTAEGISKLLEEGEVDGIGEELAVLPVATTSTTLFPEESSGTTETSSSVSIRIPGGNLLPSPTTPMISSSFSAMGTSKLIPKSTASDDQHPLLLTPDTPPSKSATLSVSKPASSESLRADVEAEDGLHKEPKDQTPPSARRKSSPSIRRSRSPSMRRGSSASRASSSGGERSASDTLSEQGEHRRNSLSEDVPSAGGNGGEDLPSSLVQPLCQILLTLFNFHEKNSLLRESAALLLVKQGLLGNQANKSADGYVEMYMVYKYASAGIGRQIAARLQDLWTWPGFQYIADRWMHLQDHATMNVEEESDGGEMAEELRTKLEARSRLLHVLPDAFVRILGYEEASSGLRRAFELVQSEERNKSLLYGVLVAWRDLLAKDQELGVGPLLKNR